MEKVILNLRKDLKKNVDPAHKIGESKFFKGQIKNYGVRSAIVKKIAQKHFSDIKNLDKSRIFCLCETLLKSNYNEEAMIAFNWSFRLKKQFEKKDFQVFEKWLKKYVDNWAKCDIFCAHSFGILLVQFPEFMPHIKKYWAKSKNRWLRRASAVILITGFHKGAGLRKSEQKVWLKHCFEIVDILLLDQDDLVQKGYGWMLKEASNVFQKSVFDYVILHKKSMPRTALRYAIEKMPQPLRHQAMAR